MPEEVIAAGLTSQRHVPAGAPVQEVDSAGGEAALHDVGDVGDVNAARSCVGAHHHAALPAIHPHRKGYTSLHALRLPPGS